MFHFHNHPPAQALCTPLTPQLHYTRIDLLFVVEPMSQKRKRIEDMYRECFRRHPSVDGYLMFFASKKGAPEAVGKPLHIT